MASYPPLHSPPTWSSSYPSLPLPPIFPPAESLLSFPNLPSPLRQPALDMSYALSTHLIPAAYLRITPDITVPTRPLSGDEKADIPPTNVRLRDELVKLNVAAHKGELGSGCEKILWICLNRYVRKDLEKMKRMRGAGVTLFFAHANGLPKELWEPTIHHLSSHSTIDEIWCWESIQHGDSGLLNAGNLGSVFNWTDNARDILNFLLYYLPSTVTSSVLPTHLNRLPVEETELRRSRGFHERTFVAVGHSFGGCSTILAALTSPFLFSLIILIDPVIQKPGFYQERAKDSNYKRKPPTLSALDRREHWPSRGEALSLFTKSPFFGAWEPTVRKLYVECGLIEAPSSSLPQRCTLKTPRLQEAAVFADMVAPYIAWERMDKLDERIELRWIMPDILDGLLGSPEAARERVWRRPKNSSNIIIPGTGHLIAQQAPKELAFEIGNFLERKYSVPPVKSSL